MEKNVIVFADKYQGIDWYFNSGLMTFVHQDEADLTEENYWIEGNDIPDYVKGTALSEFGCSEFVLDSSLNVESFEVFGIETFDIFFNDSENSNNKGFRESFDYCLNYIDMNQGTYFQDYPEGLVSIVCNETGKTVFAKTFTIESYQ